MRHIQQRIALQQFVLFPLFEHQQHFLQPQPFRLRAARRGLPFHQHANAAVTLQHARHAAFFHRRIIFVRHIQQRIALQQFVLFPRHLHAALMQEDHVIADFFQIGHDMRTEQNRVFFLPREVVEQVEDFVAHNGVKAACRLVQYEQLRLVAQRDGNRQLHLRAARKILHRLALRQIQPRAERRKRRVVPVCINAVHHLSDLLRG